MPRLQESGHATVSSTLPPLRVVKTQRGKNGRGVLSRRYAGQRGQVVMQCAFEGQPLTQVQFDDGAALWFYDDELEGDL